MKWYQWDDWCLQWHVIGWHAYSKQFSWSTAELLDLFAVLQARLVKLERRQSLFMF